MGGLNKIVRNCLQSASVSLCTLYSSEVSEVGRRSSRLEMGKYWEGREL
jgi:hypothetical protein